MAVLGALGVVNAAQAANATASFDVTANVVASCSVSGTTMAFGTYSPAAAANGTSTLTVTCTNGSAYTVKLSSASGFKMAHETDTANLLAYKIYSDSGRTTDVSGATPIAIPGTLPGTGLAQSIPLYGQIPAGTTSVKAGNYKDTVTVTVAY